MHLWIDILQKVSSSGIDINSITFTKPTAITILEFIAAIITIQLTILNSDTSQKLLAYTDSSSAPGWLWKPTNPYAHPSPTQTDAEEFQIHKTSARIISWLHSLPPSLTKKQEFPRTHPEANWVFWQMATIPAELSSPPCRMFARSFGRISAPTQPYIPIWKLPSSSHDNWCDMWTRTGQRNNRNPSLHQYSAQYSGTYLPRRTKPLVN